jgi:hypothetical protein
MRTKRTAFLLSVDLLILLWVTPSLAQQANEFTPTVSYLNGGSASVANGSIRYENAVGYGFTVGQRVEENVNAEISYSIVPTKGHFDPSSQSAASPVSMDFTIHYLQFGAAYHALVEAIEPYLSTTCGVVWFRPSDTRYAGDWRVAFSVAVGIKFFVTQNVGLRMQGRAMFPLYFSEGGLWGGIDGTGSGFHAGIPLAQSALDAGLIISF